MAVTEGGVCEAVRRAEPMMDPAVAVARNSGILLVGQVVSRLAALATFILLTRYLSVSEIGTFGYATTLVGFLALAVEFGLDPLVTREVAVGSGAHLPGLALSLKSILFAALYPVLLVVAWRGAAPAGVLVPVAVLGAAVWHESANRTLAALFLARGRAEYGLASEVLTAAVRLGAVFCVLKAGFRLGAVASAYFLSSAVAVVSLATVAYRRGLRLSRTVPKGETFRVLTEASGFVVYALLFQIYFRIDVIILGAFRPPAEVGQYIAGFRVIEALLVFPAVLTGALFPVLSRLYASRDPGFVRACSEATRHLALLGAGLALAVGLAAPQVIRVIAGAGYDDAARYLGLLSLSFALMSINSIALLTLNAVGHQRRNVAIMLAGAIVKVGWDLLLIPRYGALAACVGSAVTEAAVTAGAVLFVAPWLAPAEWFGAWRAPVAAGGAALVLWVVAAPFSASAQLPLAAVAFVLVGALFGAVRRRDLLVILRLLGMHGT